MGCPFYEDWLRDIRLSRKNYAGLMQFVLGYVLAEWHEV